MRHEIGENDMACEMNDYIKRDELYNNLILLAKYQIGERQQGILGCAETVRMCPAADVAPVVYGHWIKDSDSFQTDDYYCVYFDYTCSECGKIANDRHKLPNYCPNCGAKMDEETGCNIV